MRVPPYALTVLLGLAVGLPACGGGPDAADERPEPPEVTLARTLDEASRLIRRGQPRAFLLRYTPPEALAARGLEARLPEFSRRQTKVQAALRAARVAGPELATDGGTARFDFEGLALRFTRRGARWFIEVR